MRGGLPISAVRLKAAYVPHLGQSRRLVAVETNEVALRPILLASLALLAFAGCGNDGQKAGAHVVRVTERDFRISAPKHVRPGDLLLSVRNRGPDAHELIVVRDRSSRLPLRRGGSTGREGELQPPIAGALE